MAITDATSSRLHADDGDFSSRGLFDCRLYDCHTLLGAEAMRYGTSGNCQSWDDLRYEWSGSLLDGDQTLQEGAFLEDHLELEKIYSPLLDCSAELEEDDSGILSSLLKSDVGSWGEGDTITVQCSLENDGCLGELELDSISCVQDTDDISVLTEESGQDEIEALDYVEQFAVVSLDDDASLACTYERALNEGRLDDDEITVYSQLSFDGTTASEAIDIVTRFNPTTSLGNLTEADKWILYFLTPQEESPIRFRLQKEGCPSSCIMQGKEVIFLLGLLPCNACEMKVTCQITWSATSIDGTLVDAVDLVYESMENTKRFFVTYSFGQEAAYEEPESCCAEIPEAVCLEEHHFNSIDNEDAKVSNLGLVSVRTRRRRFPKFGLLGWTRKMRS